jgi:hypothetical protein
MRRSLGSLVVLCGLGLLSQSATIAADQPAGEAPRKTAWKPLFDGKSLSSWELTGYGGEGEVTVADGVITMQQGSELTGIHWKGEPLPKVNYELRLEAKRIDGSDFFCGIVFPHVEQYCSFVVGGWGGGVVGLSSVDGIYASENETASFHHFKDDTWYRIRLRVATGYVQAWIDDEQVVKLDLQDRKLSVHPAVSIAKPLGFSCFSTVAGLRKIEFRELTAEESITPEPAKPATK